MTLDEEANRAFIKAQELGEAVKLSGLIKQDVVFEFLPQPDESLPVDIVIWPIVPQRSFPAKIEFVDENEKPVVQIPYIQIKLERSGTAIEKWQGFGLKEALLCTLTEEYPSKTRAIQIKRNPARSSDIGNWIRYLEFLELTSTVTKIIVTDLEDGGSLIFDFAPPNIPVDQVVLHRRVLNNFSIIENELDIKFEMPDTLDAKTLQNAEGLVEVLTTGYTSKPIGLLVSLPKDQPLSVIMEAKNVPQTMQKFKEQGSITFFLNGEDPNIYIALLEHQINLGPIQYVFGHSDILNVDQLETLEMDGIEEDKPMEIIISPNWDETFVNFLNWPRNSGNTDAT